MINWIYCCHPKIEKYILGQKSKVAQAQLWKVIHGKSISNDDAVGLSEFYYTISDCLVNMHQLNYQSDIYSSNVLWQAVRRLPTKLHGKLAEHCLKLRQKTEPNLIHLESWLQDRVLAIKEAHMSNYSETNKQKVFERRKQYKRDVVQEQKWSCTTSTTKRTCIKCNKPTHKLIN